MKTLRKNHPQTPSFPLICPQNRRPVWKEFANGHYWPARQPPHWFSSLHDPKLTLRAARYFAATGRFETEYNASRRQSPPAS